MNQPQLTTQIGPLQMNGCVMTASGTAGYGPEYAGLMDFSKLGALVTKTITLRPRAGNPPPRAVETPAGMLNAIGLANVGLEAFLTEKLPALNSLGCPVIVNIAGEGIDEYVSLAEQLEQQPELAGIELNVSCPNVAGGMRFATDSSALKELVEQVRAVVRRCALIVKLSPNVTDIRPLAAAVVEAGADAVSLINTLSGMVVDTTNRRPALGNVTGGLSGPAIRPIAVHMVHQTWRDVTRGTRTAVIGIGGIRTAEDALQFILAGASAVQVGTALFIDPNAASSITDGIAEYMRQHRIETLAQLVGSLQYR